MPYYLLTVVSSARNGFGLQVEPTVHIKELAARVTDAQVPVPGDMLLLRFPDGRTYRAPLAEFGIDTRQRDGAYVTRSKPADPEFTLIIAFDDEAPELPVGTKVWLDDSSPTGGHRTAGWKKIIENITSARWYRVDPDTPTALT